MNHRSWERGAAWTVAILAMGAGVLACQDLSEIGAPGDLAGGSSGGSGPPPDQPTPPDANPEADPGTPFACEGLDQEAPVVLYLSADDSNSMGSPVHTRELIRAGSPIDPSRIRTHEFLNYYQIAYEAAPPGLLRLIPQMEPGAEPGVFDFQIGVRSADAAGPRRPMTITFVLDTSGSMSGEPMKREQAVVRAVASSLAAGDIVNLVTWNTSNAVILSGHEVAGPDDPALLDAADALHADGGTDLESGLEFGYDLAQQHYGPERLNRVILVSDGGANVGVTAADLIALHSEDADQEGIYLVGVGTGPAYGYNDALRDEVTDKGRGAYVYLDSVDEAFHMFRDRFDEVMEVAARGVQVELTLPWYLRIERFFGEEYSTNPEEIEPQHLAPGDAMIFNQIVRACDPAMIKEQDTIRVTARWQAPLTYEPQEVSVESTVADILASGNEQLTKGKAIVAYAEALKAGTKEALQAAHAQVLQANPGGDQDLNEIADLLAKHPAF